ncbi:MAG: putative metal-binding motif-containing protein [Pseudomonadota bacterium]
MIRNALFTLLAFGLVCAPSVAQNKKKSNDKDVLRTQQTTQSIQQVGEINAAAEAPAAIDADGDGERSYMHGGADCDDNDAKRYPGNVEIADPENRDEDCNPETFGERDYDGDGFFDAAACNERSDGSMNCGRDCNDRNARIHPVQIDILNGRDDNCNIEIDEDQTVEQLLELLNPR